MFSAAAGAGGLGIGQGSADLNPTRESMRSYRKQPKQPNLLFILSDDQGWGDLGCYGHRMLKTPNLDQLAKQGCRLTDFYVTTPVCSPTRSAFLTGRDPNRYAMKHIINNGWPNSDWPRYHHLPVDEPMFSRHLQRAGYRTAHIGKWHLSMYDASGEPGPGEYGYDHYLINLSPQQYRIEDPAGLSRNGERLLDSPGWTDELYVDESIRFIDENRGQPFFLHLNFHNPHLPEECSDAFRNMYAGLTSYEKTYYGCVSQMDYHLGRLFDHLKNRNLLESTIVVFTSDNGADTPLLDAQSQREQDTWARRGSNGPFRGGKARIYEGGIRVPAIVCWPGLTEPGSISNVPSSILDFFPTLSATLGLPMADGVIFDGCDLRPALTGKSLARPHALFWQFDWACCGCPPLAIRQGRWKLLCNADFSSPSLYNLDIDPGEQWNLSAIHPEVTEELLCELRGIHADVNKPYDVSRYLNPKL